MITALEQEQAVPLAQRIRRTCRSVPGVVQALLLTAWCLLVHGYHPYGEDGGVYLSGIKWLLHPQLYPQYTGFVTAHLHLSLFPWLVAMLVRETHCPLMPMMFCLYLCSIWLTLIAGWQLAARCFPSYSERSGAVLLLAAWLTLPIAGTSLMVADPYLTARSFATPLSVFALGWMLEYIAARRIRDVDAWRPLAMCGAACSLSVVMHPLMSLYTLFCLGLLAVLASRSSRRPLLIMVCVLAPILVGGIFYYLAPVPSAAYLQVTLTRTYWFIDQWRWYEWCGLIAPLAIFVTVYAGRHNKKQLSSYALLACMCAVSAASCGLMAVFFAQTGSRTMLIASLQPLRQLQLPYVVMILGLGAAFNRYVARGKSFTWLTTMLLLGCVMFFVQRQTYPNSRHVEAPGRAPSNDWEQAFVWIRDNTLPDAVFVLDTHYTSELGEDTQNFQAIAERSSPPDYSKDGGVASIAPGLAAAWSGTQPFTERLDRSSDTARVSALRRVHAQWIVLPTSATTSLPCPFINGSAMVCRER